MKYIKLYEADYPFDNDPIRLKPGFMYLHFRTPICFLGNNASLKNSEYNSEYPLLCLIFEDSFEFIEWVSWMDNEKHLPPLNMTIRDYIIKNELIKKTMKALEKPKFASGGAKDSLKKIKELKEEFLKDEELMNLLKIEIENFEMKKTAKKYNL